MRLEIIKNGINGEGIGYVKNQPVFVEDALPNECVEVKITEKNKNYLRGHVEKIIRKSSHRVKPACKYYEKCKACSCMIADKQLQKQIKEENLKQSLYKYAHVSSTIIEPLVTSEKYFHYRNACKIPLKMRNNQLVSGMYAPNSNYFVEIPECIVHEKQIEQIRKEILAVLNEYHYKEYDAKTKSGMRTLVIRTLEGKAQVTLVTGNMKIDDACVQKIMAIENVISLFQNIHTKKKSADIFSDKMILLSEKRFLETTLNGVKIRLSPRSFFQLNTNQAKILYELAAKEVNGADLLVEAYSGVGGISFMMKDVAKEIIGIESIPDAVKNASLSAKENKLSHISFICDDAANGLAKISKKRKIDVLIVDPPRSGLDDAMIETILKSRISKIIYISCNPATLGKNLNELQKYYEVKKVIPVDMFPQTPLVESIVILSKLHSKHHAFR